VSTGVAVFINETASEYERAVFGARLLMLAIESHQLSRTELYDLLLDLKNTIAVHSPSEIGLLP
jgi:hypothetical protein